MTNNTNRAAEAAQPASGDPKAIFKQLWDASQNMLQLLYRLPLSSPCCL
jgi:hypothetical protein